VAGRGGLGVDDVGNSLDKLREVVGNGSATGRRDALDV
jgi:hypothetical protein